jgi:hypothetical protein
MAYYIKKGNNIIGLCDSFTTDSTSLSEAKQIIIHHIKIHEDYLDTGNWRNNFSISSKESTLITGCFVKLIDTSYMVIGFGIFEYVVCDILTPDEAIIKDIIE